MRQGLSRPFWLALVIAAFCLPLFFGLTRTDVENDEGIYSYAVDRILATGDWLNPRSSPHQDEVFLEKPPLKFWIVAAPISLGLLPHNEFGLRFWDALFGAIALVYVFLIGRWLSGELCGFVAVLVLFLYGPLLFDHGLRTNNMEAALFLCYCGGVYHYLAWGRAGAGAGRRHIAAVALYFYLGFMTKFVAALFLPLTVGAASLIVAATRRRLIQDLRWWAAAAGLVLALVLPWFLYQQITSGSAVWRTMFGTHVLTRFTSSLDAGHVRPWYFYWTEIWRELVQMGMAWLAVAGFAWMCVSAWRQRRLEPVTVIIWLIVPLGLISLGTSKLIHYAYPFLPAVALAVGFGPSEVARAAAGYVDRLMRAIHERLSSAGLWTRSLRYALMLLAVCAAGVAVATLLLGNVAWRVGDTILFRNSHLGRPLMVALAAATLAGRGVEAARLTVPAAVLLLVLPMNAYEDTVGRMKVEAHPLRTARDCLGAVRDKERAAGAEAPGVYAIGEQRWFLHSYFYYLHQVGGWQRSEALDPAALADALFVPGRQRPVLVGDDDYRAFKAAHGEALQAIPMLGLREVLLLMPGPYAACAPRDPGRLATPHRS